jgi:hypothetical protein
VQHNSYATPPTSAQDLQAPFNGIIDDVRIYNRALNATEIASLYQQSAKVITYRYDVNGMRTAKEYSHGESTYYILGADGQTEAVLRGDGSLDYFNIIGNSQVIGRVVSEH